MKSVSNGNQGRDPSGAKSYSPIPTTVSPIPAQSPRKPPVPQRQRAQTEFDKSPGKMK